MNFLTGRCEKRAIVTFVEFRSSIGKLHTGVAGAMLSAARPRAGMYSNSLRLAAENKHSLSAAIAQWSRIRHTEAGVADGEFHAKNPSLSRSSNVGKMRKILHARGLMLLSVWLP